jgi:hypothetical protein
LRADNLVVSPNAFIGKAKEPTDAELATALGPAKVIWDQLLADFANESGIVDQEWNSYSLKAGWALRLKHQRRNTVYLSPRQDCFLTSFALGNKAMQAARQCKLPPPVIKIINEAKKYAEGTGVRLEVKAPKDIESVKKLAAIKLPN